MIIEDITSINVESASKSENDSTSNSLNVSNEQSVSASQEQSTNDAERKANLQSIIINEQSTAVQLEPNQLEPNQNQNESIKANILFQNKHNQGKRAVIVSPEASSHGTNDSEEEQSRFQETSDRITPWLNNAITSSEVNTKVTGINAIVLNYKPP